MSAPNATKVSVGSIEFAQGLREEEGWIDMLVQFLITEDTAGSEGVVFGRTVFRPGSRHEAHRHVNAEEVQFLLSGEGIVIDGDQEIPVVAGDVVFSPKGSWHGFINTSAEEDAVVIWLWAGAGSRDKAGYEVHSEVQKTTST